MKRIVSIIFIPIFMLLVLFSPYKAKANISANTVDINVTASFDEGNKNTSFKLPKLPYGNSVDIKFNDSQVPKDYEFAFWIIDGIVNEDLSFLDNSFIASNNLEIIAVFSPLDKNAVVFVDHSGKLIETKYITNGNSVIEPSILPTKKGYKHNETNKWLSINGSKDLSLINTNTVFKLQYTKITTDDITITISDNIKDNLVVSFNEIVTIESKEKYFSHWEENGKIISYNKSYSFSALYNRNIREVTSRPSQDETPLISMSELLGIRPGYSSKVVQIYLPENYSLIEYGYLVSKDNKILDLSNSTIVKSNSIHPTTNEYITSIINDYTNIRAYAIYYNGTNYETIYSDLIEVEYVETFKFKEKYNSYQDFEFNGTNDVLWSAVHSRNNDGYDVDGHGILLRNEEENSSFTGIFKNGLNSISFNYRKAYTGGSYNRKYSVDITNNNTTKTYIIPTFGEAGTDPKLYTFTKEDLNLTGETKVQIYATGTAQATFGNFKWTEYQADIIEIPKHSVMYDTNGGTIVQESVVKDNNLLQPPLEPYKAGYIFDGWYYNNELFNFNTTPIISDILLVAKWTESDITFNEVELFTIDFGSTNVPTYDTNTLTFTNLNNNIEYNLHKERANIDNNEFNMAPLRGDTFSYLEFDLSRYDNLTKLSFNMRARNSNSAGRISKMDDVSLSLEYYDGQSWVRIPNIDNQENIISNLNNINLVNETFLINLKGLYRIAYNVPSATTINNTDFSISIDDITVYGNAASTNNALVTYDFNFAGEIPLVVPYPLGTTITNPPLIERPRYKFNGWLYNGSIIDLNKLIINKDITLTASFTKEESFVVFDTGHLDNLDATSNTYEYLVFNGNKIKELHTPDRQGYTFNGWYQVYTNKDNHIPFDFNNKITEDTRLIAKWTKDKENPTYIRDDAKLATYYSSLVNKKDKALFTELRTIISTNHHEVDYGTARFALEDIDRHPYDNTKVLGIYDRAMYIGPWNHPNWEREHVWPNSKLGVPRAVNATTNQASDLHNLRAILPVVNQRRGNRYFVEPQEINYSPVGHIVGPGTYYPGDEDIGDVSRIFLYMAVRYEDLKLTDNTSLLSLTDNNIPISAYMGKLSVLYNWHLQDPVDEFEVRRNELIYQTQGNRNPFIDHPELFEEVYNYLLEVDLQRPSGVVNLVVNDGYIIQIDYEFFKRKQNTLIV